MPSAKKIAERQVLAEAQGLIRNSISSPLTGRGYVSAESFDPWPQAYGEKNWTWLKEQDGLARIFRVTFERKTTSDTCRFTIELDVKDVLGPPSTSMRTNIWRVLTDNGAAGNAATRSWTVVKGEGLIDCDVSLEHATETGLDWLDSFTSQHHIYDHLVAIERWPAAIPLGIELGRPEAPAQLRQSLASSLLFGNTKFWPSLRRLAHEHGVDVSAVELEGYKLCAVSRSSEGVGEAASLSEVEATPIPEAVRSRFVQHLLEYGSANQYLQADNAKPTEWFAGRHSYTAVQVETNAIWFTSRFAISSLSTALVTAYDLCSNEDLALFDPQTQQWDDVDLTAPELDGYRLSLFSPGNKAADTDNDLDNTQHPPLPDDATAQLIERLTNSEYRFKRVSNHGPVEVFCDGREAVTVAVREDQINIATGNENGFLAFRIASELAAHGTLTVSDLQTGTRFNPELLSDAMTDLPNSQYPEAIRRMRLAELSGFDVLAADSKHWYDVLLVAPSSRDAFQSGVPFADIQHETIDESVRVKVVDFLERRNYRRIEGQGLLGRFEHDPGVAVTVSQDRIWFVASNDPALAAEDGPVFEALQTASEITSIVELAKFDPQSPGVWDDGLLPES